jgi:hypothetical protein
MRGERRATVILMILCSLLVSLQNIAAVRADEDSWTFETFDLHPGPKPTIRNVELQMGDRLVGYYTITNLQTWENEEGENQSYSVSVYILTPRGYVGWRNIFHEGDFFVGTAGQSGVYKIQFSVYAKTPPPSGIENPQATLNYTVITRSPSDYPPSDNPPNWMVPTLILGVISIGVALTTYYAVNKREKASH